MYKDQAANLRKIMAQKRKPAKIITVASGKGGVGKSNIAVNLGLIYTKMGKKVLVMDADLGLANINVILGVIPKFTLFNFMKGQKSLKEIIIELPNGLNIIAGASGFSKLADMSKVMREKFISELETFEQYDLIIIDVGAGVSSNVISFALAADEIVIVTTPEPTAITDAYGIIKSIAVEDFEKNIKLIVNRVSSIAEARNVAERIINIAHQFLSIKIYDAGFVFEDEDLGRAVRKRKPFVELFPKGRASECVKRIAYKLENISGTEPRETKGVKEFFKRFFGVS